MWLNKLTDKYLSGKHNVYKNQQNNAFWIKKTIQVNTEKLYICSVFVLYPKTININILFEYLIQEKKFVL